MKKFFVLAVLCMACVGVQAQEKSEWKVDFKALADTTFVKGIEENGDATMLVEVDMTGEQLYRYCREWFATKYSSYKDAVQLEDKENGKLIVNCVYPVYFKGVWKGDPITQIGSETFKLTCDFKDGRFRVKATEYESRIVTYMDKFPRDMQLKNIALTNGYAKTKEAAGREELFELEYRMVLSGMAASMKEYIVKAVNDDDF